MHIARKDIDLAASPVLMRYEFTEESLRQDWEITGGEWTIQDGWLTGFYPKDGGALIYSLREFPGNVLLDFCCRSVPPCANDLNFTWCADGWDYEKNDAKNGYIGGLGGWWDGKCGMEKYPTCKPWAATPLFKVEPGRTYRVQAGSIDGHCFLFVGGQLIVEMYDPAPETLASCRRVGLGVYASHVQFGPLTVRSIRYQTVNQSYAETGI